MGLNAKSISRICPRTFLLEEHKFIPNVATLSLKESISVNIQIALESNYKNKIKIVEVSDAPSTELLLPYVIESLKNYPLVEVEAVLLTKNVISLPNVQVVNSQLKNYKDVYMVIGREVLQMPEALQENCFLLSREPLFGCGDHHSLNILTTHCTPLERLVLASNLKCAPLYKTLQITNTFEWLKPLQELLMTDDQIIIYSHDDATTGILGLINCLRREETKVRCVLICDQNAPPFTPSEDFYRIQLMKGHAINILKDGKWGTYRLFSKEAKDVSSEHCYAVCQIKGNLDSIKWVEGPLHAKVTLKHHQELVYVSWAINSQAIIENLAVLQTYYTGLNFKDVMVASNRTEHSGRLEEELIGLEYSGKLASGERVMGISVSDSGLATLIAADKDLMLKVPDSWTLEEAATVPIAYATVLYALKRGGNIEKKHSILIHSGAGGVGQAAIIVCHALGLNIFTTTSTETKKEFLQNNFPFLKASQIGCSRDASFEQIVKRATKGRGVDIVLNSLTGYKSDASLRCLAKRGVYLDIQKSDAYMDKQLSMEFVAKEIQFHGIYLDHLFLTEKKYEVMDLLRTGLSVGILRPLYRKIFDENSVSGALKFLSKGNNIGKVLVQIRCEDSNLKPAIKLLRCVPKYYPYGSIVITGGLGGFGLELADWLVNRGANNILIAARRTKLSGYEAFRLRYILY